MTDRAPTPYEQPGLDWWNSLSEDRRAYWLRAARSAIPHDAWICFQTMRRFDGTPRPTFKEWLTDPASRNEGLQDLGDFLDWICVEYGQAQSEELMAEVDLSMTEARRLRPGYHHADQQNISCIKSDESATDLGRLTKRGRMAHQLEASI